MKALPSKDGPISVLVLYRPRLPDTRAQSIQVLGTAHALAELGCQVTLIADQRADGEPTSREEILRFYDLPDVASLDLRIPEPGHKTLGGLWFRWQVLKWSVQAMIHRPYRSVILARNKAYADELMSVPFGPPLVLEAHEVDSALARERGDNPRAMERLEARLLAVAEGVVGNTRGTLEDLDKAHPGLMAANRAVVYNATNPSRVREHRPGAEIVVGYAGSLRPYKGLDTLLESAALLGPGVVLELLGGTQAELGALGPLPPRVRWAGELPYKQVPDHIQRWHAAVLPLDDNLFGQRLCNPLKLWDYRAVGLPLVAADVGSLREVLQPQDAQWFRPGDARGLAAAIQRSLVPPSRQRRRSLRSWKARARELLPILQATLG